MKCANCQTDNPANARFCFNCGHALARRCANCQAELAAGARFCSNCGHPVEAVAASEAQRESAVKSQTPPEVAAQMRAAHLAGERKVVTALFLDVVGSTALAEHMDPEDWTQIMNRAFELLAPIVTRDEKTGKGYDGTIARLLGDAMLVFFGAPVAHEDDAVRAVRASLDMLEAVRQYAVEVGEKYNIPFEVRIGLNTGPVVVGDVGSYRKFEYTAMGDAVNLAARMQSAARPMTVLISEHTYRYVAPLFEFQDLGEIAVKGKREPVRVYEVQGVKAQPGRLRGLAGLESAMVGRDSELATLLQLSAAVHAGLGRAAVIIGEPGLGKSRLIAEWKAAAAGAAQTGPAELWAEGRCLSYGHVLPYHLLIDLLRSLMGVPATAGNPEERAALEALVSEVAGPAAMEVFPYLAHLLSLPLEGEAAERVARLDAQALQNQYLAALRQLLLGLARRQPLLVVLDDIHWADPSSTDLLIKLLPLLAEAPLLLCLVTRPDREAHGWRLVTAARERLGAGLSELNLSPLNDADSRQLVSNLLEIEALPDSIRTLILQKAEGNPFFVEEVIRMLIDRGAIYRQGSNWAAGKEINTVEIPDNLQGLLLARIDRLPDDVKRTLRVASVIAVIGRQFSVRVLEQVLERLQ
ncbi:MAG: AAA family ATPase [Anaerolineales bacterium]|nr:AAA family ATPase [Anaerolineales bacterium]